MSLNLRLVFISVFAALILGTGMAGSASAAPANDNFTNRQTISGALPLTVAGNNIGATSEPGEPTIFSNTPVSTVWFSWTAPATGEMVIDVCNDGFTGQPNPTRAIAVRTGTTLGSLVAVTQTAGKCLIRFHATSGVTYQLQIDYRYNEGNFNLTLRLQNPPANDAFATPTVIGPTLPIDQQGTTVDSTWQAGEPAALGGSSQARSVWYSWTAPASERVRVSLCDLTFVDGSLNNAVIVYTGSTLGTLAAVAQLTPNDCNMDFPVTAGTTYRVAVSGTIAGEFGFILKLKSAPPPTNDNFATPEVLSSNLPVKLSGNNDFATTEVGEPDHGGYPGTSRSIWYSWTANSTGTVRLKTCGEDINLYTSVYTGSLLTALTEVGRREDWAPCSTYFDAVAGTTYRIAVAGGPFSTSHGPFSLDLHRLAVPANDSFSTAVNLGSSLYVSRKGTTVDASTEEFEPGHGEYSSSSGGSVWYRWKATSDNAVILQACSSGEPNLLAVYRTDPEAIDPAPGNLTKLDFDRDSCRTGKGGRLAIAPVKGTTYLIAVAASVQDYESPFTLTIQVSGPAAKPGFNLKQAIAKCRKLKGKKKQTACIKSARRKAALIACAKLSSPKARAKCEKKARQRFK